MQRFAHWRKRISADAFGFGGQIKSTTTTTTVQRSKIKRLRLSFCKITSSFKIFSGTCLPIATLNCFKRHETHAFKIHNLLSHNRVKMFNNFISEGRGGGGGRATGVFAIGRPRLRRCPCSWWRRGGVNENLHFCARTLNFAAQHCSSQVCCVITHLKMLYRVLG